MDRDEPLALRLVGACRVSLAMICPTKGRPEAIRRMGDAWEATSGGMQGGPDDAATLIWIVDADDPKLEDYWSELQMYPWMEVASIPEWRPMVPKLNWAARQCAQRFDKLGFLGDDHLPRSVGWSRLLAAAIDEQPHSTGIVYGRDGYQDDKLPTWWAMSSNIVKALGRMVPADVQHLYCDNAVYQLGRASDSLVYRGDVLIEHMHPVAGKAGWDEGHLRVNRNQQYIRDRLGFEAWVLDGLERDARLIADLRGV